MERLTKWFGEGENRVAGLADDLEEKYTPEEIIDILLAALAPYEDTGLEPEEIREAYSKGWHSALDIIAYAEQAGDVLVETPLLQEYINLGTLDHFRELIQAEQDGRLVVLPCKVGTAVYLTKWWQYTNLMLLRSPMQRTLQYFTISKTGIYAHFHDGCINIRAFDKIAFLTPEEAKAALEARTEDKG